MISAFMIGLPEIVAAAIIVALTGYALTGGADYGGGVWDLLASGPRRDEQRRLIADSIGPIWEANHVWLIVAVVVLFTGFPAAFGVLGTVLHVPLTILLVGIVLRGSAFVFRSYGRAERRIVERWGLVFSIASVVTPLCFGIAIGAISSDAVGRAASNVATMSYSSVYIAPWAALYAMTVGVFALALFAMLAAVYLAHAATEPALREDFRELAELEKRDGGVPSEVLLRLRTERDEAGVVVREVGEIGGGGGHRGRSTPCALKSRALWPEPKEPSVNLHGSAAFNAENISAVPGTAIRRRRSDRHRG